MKSKVVSRQIGSRRAVAIFRNSSLQVKVYEAKNRRANNVGLGEGVCNKIHHTYF